MEEETRVILVDEEDNRQGTEEKLKAHEKGLLHRAFSIFIFNSKGELMLQKRNRDKYHFGGLWTNTTCSHPFPGENVELAAHRRLQEEMGFNTKLKRIFTFKYKATSKNGLIENEFDHVFIGIYDKNPMPNPEEVEDWKFNDLESLKKNIEKYPETYTPWFRLVMKNFDFEKYLKELKKD